MIAFKHILVPTDFGEAADRALAFAIMLAEKFESKLTLLHASWVPPSAYIACTEGLSWPTAEMEKGAKKELHAALSKVRAGCPKAQEMLMTGEPWQTNLEVAKQRGVDLIVMGTDDRHGALSRVLVESVADMVARFSPIPVLRISGKAEQKAKEAAIGPTTGAQKGGPHVDCTRPDDPSPRG